MCVYERFHLVYDTSVCILFVSKGTLHCGLNKLDKSLEKYCFEKPLLNIFWHLLRFFYASSMLLLCFFYTSFTLLLCFFHASSTLLLRFFYASSMLLLHFLYASSLLLLRLYASSMKEKLYRSVEAIFCQ